MDGLRLLTAILEYQSPSSLRDIQQSFLTEEEREVYFFIRRYFNRNRELPSITLTEEECDVDLPEIDGSVDFYLQKVRNRKMYHDLRSPFQSLRECLINEDMEEAVDQIKELNRVTRRYDSRQSVFNLQQGFAHALEKYEVDRESARQGMMTGIKSGWDFLDNMTNGYQNGDLIIWAARTGMGKSYLLLHQAYQAWLEGAKVFVLSMELPLVQVSRRMIAIRSGINARYIRDGRLQRNTELDMRASVASLEGGNRFLIYIGNFGKTMADVESVVTEYNPDIVFIDGVYLLQPMGVSKGAKKQEKLPVLADELKTMTLDFNRPFVCTHKYNRASGRRGESATEDNLGGADEFTTHSSVIIGIKDCSNDADNYPCRKIEIQKGREGEQGSFHVRYSLSPMDFSQTQVEEELDTNSDTSVRRRRVNLDYMGE